MNFNETTLDEKGLVRISKRTFKNVELVDIRKFYVDKSDDKNGDDQVMKPGRQGLSLTLSQFETLMKSKDEIDRAFSEDDEISIEISAKKKASVQLWNAKMYLDLREYYEKEGEMRPGKKGIKLTIAMWKKLCAAMTTRVKEENKMIDGVKKKRDREEDEEDNSVKRGDEKRVKKEGIENNATATMDTFVALNEKGTRRFMKRTYKGIQLYDIREYYESNGEMKPGSKGISLKEDQWKVLCAEAQNVNEILKPSENDATPSSFKKNDSGEAYLELSDNRRLTIREWKGRSLIDIREFYQKNDALLPGRKGISLAESQWQILVEKCMMRVV